MSEAPLDWEACQVFLAVIRAGGLAAGASAVGLAPITARRRLAGLEARVGGPLFQTEGRRLTPTATGLALTPVAESMEVAALAFLADAAREQGEAVGPVRILTTEILGEHVLIPAFASLGADHPDLRLEVIFTTGGLDIINEEADIAVLPYGAALPGMSQVWSGRVSWGLHGHRDYLASRGAPRSRADLPAFDLIGFERPTMRDVFRTTLDLDPDDPCFRVRVDNVQAQFAAARAGLGLLLCQVPLASRWPELVRVLPEIEFVNGYCVLHADDRGGIGRVDIALAATIGSLTAYVDEASPSPSPPFAPPA